MKKATPCTEIYTTTEICMNGGGRSDSFEVEVVLARIARGIKTPKANKLLQDFEPEGASPIRKRPGVTLKKVCLTEKALLGELSKCGIYEGMNAESAIGTTGGTEAAYIGAS